MSKSEVCENDCNNSFMVTASVGEPQAFDSFACAIHLSPQHVFTESVGLLDIGLSESDKFFIAPPSPDMWEPQNFTSDSPSAIRGEAGE
jgi:hypothetical protein